MYNQTLGQGISNTFACKPSLQVAYGAIQVFNKLWVKATTKRTKGQRMEGGGRRATEFYNAFKAALPEILQDNGVKA